MILIIKLTECGVAMKNIFHGTLYFVKLVNEGYKKLWWFYITYTLASGFLPVIHMTYFKKIIQILGSPTLESMLFIKQIVFFSLFILLINSVSIYARSKADNTITRVRMNMVSKVNEKTLTMPYEQIENEEFHRRNYGVFSSLDSSDTGLEKFGSDLFELPGLIVAYVSLIVVIARNQFNYLFCIGFIMFLVVRIYEGHRYTKYKKSHDVDRIKQERNLEYLFDTGSNYDHGKEIRLYNLQNLVLGKVSTAIERLEKILARIATYQQAIITPRIFLFFTLLLTYFFSLLEKAQSGDIDISMVAFLIVTFFGLLEINQKLAIISESLYYESLHVVLLKNYMRTTAKKRVGILTAEMPILQISELGYTYKNSKLPVLRDISFTIQNKETLAIVGLNGAGKSTLIKCITGLYRNYSGSIKLYGQELKDLDKACVHEHMKVLFQDAKLYPFTVLENICSGLTGDIDKAHAVLRDLSLLERVLKSPSGLDAHITTIFNKDGIQFSSGEQQRLGFARVLYQTPSIVILDEPTCSLDSVSEKVVLKQLNDTLMDKTRIFVTHRLHNVKYADRIIVLHEGRIKEIGTHESLMKEEGLYHNLFMLQKQYYEEDGNEKSQKTS